jgi:hypothetical protein
MDRVDEFFDPLPLFQLEQGNLLIEIFSGKQLKLCFLAGVEDLP